jgi:toxin ParE1/3/4
VKFKIIITNVAKTDVKEIYNYVFFNDSPERAEKLVYKIEKCIFSLNAFPFRGHYISDLDNLTKKNYREIHYKPYRIIYRIDGASVIILAVLDGRRNIRDLLLERI